MNNIQKAKLTEIINRMKRGNPPATEGEIAKVIEAYASQEKGSPLQMNDNSSRMNTHYTPTPTNEDAVQVETMESLAKAYGDPLDMSNTETIIDKSEGVVVDAYLDSPDHPGLAVEKAGFMFGDAVNFVRPDGSRIYVDLQNDLENEQKKLDELNTWYEENEKKASLGLWGTLGAASPSADAYDQVAEIGNVNASLSKMYSEGGNNYRVVTSSTREAGMYDTGAMKVNSYKLTSDTGDDIEFEEWGDLQKHLWDNVTEEELSMLRGADLGEADVVIKESKEVEAKRYSELTDDDAQRDFYRSGDAGYQLEAGVEDLGLSAEDMAIFNGAGVNRNRDPDFIFNQLDRALRGEEVNIMSDKSTGFISNTLDSFSEDAINKIQPLRDALTLNSKELNKRKHKMADDFGSKWVQTKLKSHTNYRGIQAALDAETSSENMKPQLQAHEDKFKNLEKSAKTDIKKIDARTNDILSSIVNSNKNGSDIAYATKEINGKHIITVTGGDRELVKKYQDQINKQQGLYNNVISEYKKEHANSVDKYDTWRAEAGDYARVAGISNREMDTLTLMGEDILGGFEQMALGMPAAFGSEAAMDGLDALQAESESLAMDLGYDEAWELGETGSYIGRSISKQTANVVAAVALSSLGMPPVAVEASVGTVFGLQSGGQKRQQLRTASRMAEQAKLDMVELKALKDSMDPEEYNEQMAQLKKIEAVGDLSRAQIEGIVWGTAVIEGVVTAKLGTLPNSKAMVNAFGGKGVGVNPFMTGNQRIGNFLWKFGKGVGSEIAEEEIILFGSEILEGTINREHDISFAEWDETLVQAVMLAGPMNGPSGMYSAVTQHTAGKEYRDIFDDVSRVNTRLSRELKDPNLTEADKKKVQDEWVANLARLGVAASGLEVDAMVTGPESLRELAATAMNLNMLYAEAKVKHTDSQVEKDKKIEAHIATLSKSEGQSFRDRYDRVSREKAKIQDATKAKYDEGTALDEGGVIDQVYGAEGLRMALEMSEKDPKFKKLPDRDKLVVIHEKIKKDFFDSNVAAAKRDDKVKAMVESLVYDEVDADGNKLEGGKEGYFKRNNKKRRTPAQVKREQELYELWASQQNSRQVESITLNKDVALNAPPSLTEADIKSFDDIVDSKGEVIETAQQQLEDFINKQDIDEQNKKDIINGFRKGEVNGTIIGGKYIVLDAAQARKNLAEGTLLQATAVLHEYSHFLDNVTMKDGEMVQMAENLNKSLESNSILKLLHDAVVERGRNIVDSDGNREYNKDLPFSEQSYKAKEEYVKYAEEMLLQNRFWQQLNEAKKAGGGIANTLKKFTGGDYNFNSDGAALHYIVEYGQSWLRGEDSKLVERKKKAFVPRNDSKEGTSSESRSARDGFAEKSIAEDLGLRESTKKIVAKNEEIYQRIVNAAEAAGVKVSKALVTQRLKDELVENNLARAFALARKAAGVARNLTLDEGLKIDNVTEWFQEYSLKLAELSNTWDPSKNDSFGAYMNQLLPKKYSGILKALKSDLETSSIDTDEGTRARVEAVAVEEDTAPKSDTRRKKTNVLKIGKVEGKADAIRDVVEVNPGDTFKEVSDNNTGKVAEIIFDVPASKITDPKKNLTYAKRIVNGIPEASEAGNIQSFYIAPQTVEKLLKILPEESVSSDTADINEIGENIDVDREVLGRGLGLSNRVLNSFYDKTNKRSKGKKSQPFIWKLKPEFKNPTAETIAKVQEDLGITPRGELNNYNRDIGQLLKGVAKFQAQQTALSTAQRILTERKASKKQIASVTAAQSKVAFSENISEIGKFMRQNLSMDDAKFRDNLLLANKLAPTLRIKNPEDIKVYIDMLKRDVFPLLPYEAWFGPGKGTAFTTSSKSVGLSSDSELWALFQSEVQALKTRKDIKYGKPIKGVDMSKMWSLRNKYTPLFSTPEKARKNRKNGEIAEFNEQVGLIHEALWKRINKSIKKDRESASGIATYLGLTANDTGHWHKMGAQFAGFSTELTKRKKDKKGKDQKIRVEYEHAMPATQAYLYLLNAAINHNESFDYTYGKIIENYKLIALDKAMDDKLRYARTKSGKSLMTNMTDGWNPETGFWWERYFNDIVYVQDGGIDPSSIEGLDGKTFAEKLNINAQGVDPAFEFARDINARDEDSKVMDKALKASRSGTKKLIDGLVDNDVADTLADAVSGVNPDGYSNVRFSRSHRAEYEQRLLKNRAGLNTSGNKKVAEKLVDDLFKWLDSPSFYLGASSPIYAAKHKSKFEKLALHYMVHNKLILPEDGFKVIEAEKLAKANKIDPFSFKNPNEIIEKYSEEVDGKRPTNPDEVAFFTNKQELENGITIYDVDSSRSNTIRPGSVASTNTGHQAVRDQVNQHFGKKSNPWCIVQANDGKLTGESEEYWDNYGNKQIIFKDGKLLAMRTESREDGFSGEGNVEFWSRDNVKYNEIPGNNYVDEQGRTVMSSFDEKTGEKTGILYGATKGSTKSGKIEIYGTYTESKGHHNPNMYPYLKNGEQPQLYLEYVERYNKDGEYHGISEEHTNPTAMKRENYESSIVTIKEYKNGKFVGSRTDRGDGQGLRPMQRVGADGILRSSDVMFSKSAKGITVLDFDDTLATTKSNVLYTMPGSKVNANEVNVEDITGWTTSKNKAILVVGGAGSGKSTLISGLAKRSKGFTAVNADAMVEAAASKKGLDLDYNKMSDKQRREVDAMYAKSNKAANEANLQGMKQNKGLLIEVGTSDSGVVIKQAKKLKDSGYEVKLMSVDTDLETAIKRNKSRSRTLEDTDVEHTFNVFDDNISTLKKEFGAEVIEFKDGFANVEKQGKLNAEEFAKKGGDLLAQGVKFDFSEFNKVVKGETAPLFNKAMKLYGKFGAENMFILTARAPESQLAIKQFLDAQGLKIPLKNITGLGKSEASAKANWIAEKVGEGYNDFYFADDAIQNVDAVREKLDELQVKNKVQQAKIKFSMNTKRDLNWKSTDRVTFTLDGKRVTEGKIYNASFKVGDNDYIIRLTNRPLSVNFDQGVVSGKSAFDLEFSLENQADELWDGAGKMGVEGTGRASEVLSIVSNGVMDFIKNNDVDAIGFSSADTSRTRLYNTLTKFWASRLGWEWTSQTFKPDKRTGEDFTGGKFIISNPNAIKPTVEPSTIEVENRAQEPKLKRNTPRPDIKRGVKFSKSKSTTPLDLYKPYSESESDPYGVKLKSVPSNVLKSKGYKTFIKALQGELIHGSQVKASDLESNGSKRSLNWFTLSRNRAEGVEYAKFIEREFEGEEDNEVLVTNVSKFKDRILPDFEAIDIQTWDKKDTEKRNAVGKRLDKKYGEVPYQNKDIFNHPRASELIADLIDIIIEQNPSGNYALETFNGGLITQNYPVVVLGGIKPGDLKTAFTKDLGSESNNRSTEEKNMLNMFDIKGTSQKARVKFSKSGPKKMASIIDESELDLNTILEQSKGVGKEKTFSAAKARQRGKNKGKFKFFVPPSADDFAGLMNSFKGKGKQGDKHHAWFKKNLFDPFSKGIRRHKMVQQQVASDMKNLRKAMPDVRKKLGKKVPGTEYTHEDAIRIYNWSQAGLDIPGLSQTDATALINAVESDAKLLAFAQGVNSISNTPGGMVDPGPHWTGGNIALDLKEALDNARSTNLQQWIDNKNIIFSEANMNKIEAVYGSNFREALEDSLYRMETGSTQNVGKDRLLGNFTAWIHGSIGTTMFLNARSAMLQMISNVNFINWSDNNMLKAAGAFANQKQYWKDVSMIFNSPFLKQRRSGIQTDVNAAELLAQIKDSKNKLKAATAHLLQLGFTPTQIADSFAIATGGATFYRNRMKTYLKEGMTQADAETKAFEDMMEIAEETQQSTRADKISQQQASPIGKFLLAFQNTPMQYNRLIKKAAQDLVNGRGDPKANISRIVYYGGIQNLIFYGLQTALFAALFSDDEEDDITGKKTERVVNGMVDTLLRGSGIGGAVVSTVKNVIMKFMKESEKMDDGIYYTDPDWGNVVIEALNISPPIGIKARKIYSGLKTWEYNKDVIDTMDKTDVDNPIYDAVASVTEAVTNVPLSRMYNKFQNISEALNSDHDTWKRVAMLLGWSKWSFGIKNQDVIDAKGEAKIIKAAEKKEGNRSTFVDDQKKEKDEGKKDITCAASTRSGGRCGNKVVGGGNHCTVHEKVKQNDTGKKTQCTHVKSDGKRCKMKTNSKSGKCYYHD